MTTDRAPVKSCFYVVLFVVGWCACSSQMSNVCSVCQSTESASAAKCFVRAGCVGRRVPPIAVCESRVDNGHASSLGTWPPGAPSPLGCNICCALDATKFREAVVDDIKDRWGPLLVC